MRKEFTLGKLKPKYALMNKVVHNMIETKEKREITKEGRNSVSV